MSTSRDTFQLTNILYKQFEKNVTKPVPVKEPAPKPVPKPERYTGVRLQQGVPLVDADWNELEDIRKYEHRLLIKTLIGDGVPSGSNGFQIDAFPKKDHVIKPIPITDLIISMGVCYVCGWMVINPDEIRYTYQELYNTDIAKKRGITPLLPIESIRNGFFGVFLDVWEREINRLEDDRIVNKLIDMETCTRIKQEWVVRLEKCLEGETPQVTKEPGHEYYLLTKLTVNSEGVITDNADARRTDLAVLDKDYMKSIILADSSVTAGKLAPNSVISGNLAPGSVTAGNLDANAVNSVNITPGSVTFDKIAFNEQKWEKVVVNPNDVYTCSSSSYIVMRPYIWKVYPVDDGMTTSNHYCHSSPFKGEKESGIYWYEITYKANGKYINAMRVWNVSGGPITVTVVLWTFSAG